MSYLLDTHILLWWLMDDSKLKKPVRKIIASEPVWISTAVVWEMVIKSQLGKLIIPDDIETVLQDQCFDVLDIKIHHVTGLYDLEDHHSDPIDRIQIAQAKTDGLIFITKDSHIQNYKGVNIYPV